MLIIIIIIIIKDASTRFSSNELKARRLYQHTHSRATNIVYIHTTKTTVYKTYMWCIDREIAIRKLKGK